MELPSWNARAFGCLIRDSVRTRSLLRTQLSASMPAPFVSRKADTSAPVEMDFSVEMTDAAFRSWQQWYTYDLADGSLPFTMFIPWGTVQPRVVCRLLGNWQAQRIDALRWTVSGMLQIERESLPRFSGGTNANDGIPGTWNLQPATSGDFTGFRSGAVEPPNYLGQLSPTTIKGAPVRRLFDYVGTGGPLFQIQLGGQFPQDFFATVTLLGHTFTSASAVYGGAPAPNTVWYWPTLAGIVAGVSTVVEFA